MPKKVSSVLEIQRKRKQFIKTNIIILLLHLKGKNWQN